MIKEFETLVADKIDGFIAKYGSVTPALYDGTNAERLFEYGELNGACEMLRLVYYETGLLHKINDNFINELWLAAHRSVK